MFSGYIKRESVGWTRKVSVNGILRDISKHTLLIIIWSSKLSVIFMYLLIAMS